jgi:hypothetical protein
MKEKQMPDKDNTQHHMRLGQLRDGRETFYSLLTGPSEIFSDRYYAMVISSNDRSHTAALFGGTILVGHRSTVASGINDPGNFVSVVPQSDHTHIEHRINRLSGSSGRSNFECNLIDRNGITTYIERFVPTNQNLDDPSHRFFDRPDYNAFTVTFNGQGGMGISIGGEAAPLGTARLKLGDAEVGVAGGVPYYKIAGQAPQAIGAGGIPPGTANLIERLAEIFESDERFERFARFCEMLDSDEGFEQLVSLLKGEPHGGELEQRLTRLERCFERYFEEMLAGKAQETVDAERL